MHVNEVLFWTVGGLRDEKQARDMGWGLAVMALSGLRILVVLHKRGCGLQGGLKGGVPRFQQNFWDHTLHPVRSMCSDIRSQLPLHVT